MGMLSGWRGTSLDTVDKETSCAEDTSSILFSVIGNSIERDVETTDLSAPSGKSGLPKTIITRCR